MKALMPDFYWDYDSQSQNPHFPLFKFIDAAFGEINDAVQIYADWFEYELSELPYDVSRSQLNTKSRLLNPDAFYLEYSDWIWQFLGEKIKRNVYDKNNTPYVDNEEDYIRWQARTSSFGRASGTRQSIRESAQFVLSGQKFIAITPNFNSEPFLIGIRTLDSETPELALTVDDVVRKTIEISNDKTLIFGSFNSVNNIESNSISQLINIKNVDKYFMKKIGSGFNN
jgi:hypothetical protein